MENTKVTKTMDDKQYTVFLAVDPYEPEVMPTSGKLSWFKEWASQRNAAIEVVYVLTGPDASEEEALEKMKTTELKNVKNTVLIDRSSSQRKAVKSLVDYAQKKQSDLIVLSSHGRSGFGRFVLGSFAEKLLASSNIPLLFLNEPSGSKPPAKKILFPTDFSEASKYALDLFMKQMEGYQGELILFNVVPPPGAVSSTVFLGVPVYLPESYWFNMKKWRDEEAEALLHKVKAKGFNARMELNVGMVDIAEAIEKCAETENVSMIAMASVSRGLDHAVIGSVSRPIFRAKKWPVWVCGPEALRKGIPTEVVLV